MEFLSSELTSTEYRDRLRDDLHRASVCRFLIAYVSAEGLKRIGEDRLVSVLRHADSFGVSSLTCAIGYQPLLRLQRLLGHTHPPKLKYFMDPLVKDTDDPEVISLFHSKIVYLVTNGGANSVLFLGSHNWSQRALGTDSPRNAEASIRLEASFAHEHLSAQGDSIFAKANRHLLRAYNFEACLTATVDNERAFKQWDEVGCRRSRKFDWDNAIILVCVLSSNTDDAPDWSLLNKGAIYFQALDETDGSTVWGTTHQILVIVWQTITELRAGRQPVLLRCRRSTEKAGPSSTRAGTNQSPDPLEGFSAVILDEAQLASVQAGMPAAPSRSETLWSGVDVRYFDFRFPSQTRASDVDGNIVPTYQFYLEVEDVVFPADGPPPPRGAPVWHRSTFAVAASKDDTEYQSIPGYEVPPEFGLEIEKALQVSLGVDRSNARVFPVWDFDRSRLGKRVARHPLHDAFISAQSDESPVLSSEVRENILIPDVDLQRAHSARMSKKRRTISNSVQRVERVYTTSLETLERLWLEAGRQAASRPRRDEGPKKPDQP